MSSFRPGRPLLDESLLREAARRLLSWAREGLTPLPWRGERDPYRVWVSEVMLQQTRRETVVPYYQRFLERFPSIESLAAADQQEVLKLWEGLGYYARARNLHAAARRVVEDCGGELPANRRRLTALPGIGPYTAGAILSLAFGQDEAVVDGNVRRVLCRLALVQEDPRRPTVERDLWATARALILPGQAGRVNEALMELGALICLPRRPRCPDCPLASLCRAHQAGREEAVPLAARRGPLPHHQVCAAVIRQGRRVLLAQRHQDDLLGGMWEFPGGTCLQGEALPDCLRREIAEELGLEIEVGDLLDSLPHAYTHFRITLHAFFCRRLAGEPRALDCADWRWLTLEQAAELPLSVVDRRILEILRKQAR
ncbi:MAG: A/G-specific adenine glycosylase [Chloroflexia bacterium]|nr:A/G-specific adenine glycosylase [Chloroflexia bacterium]